ncbi:hypothetical protein [Allorhizocola rhizosphaerae]|uniref:hypothetical protein n=1 Tax=Allorhizocola rhizosphaerae TaxID=1872709 RepID=UPI0013C2C8FD|nr:hypothetical protein [Allorhizocola rhizosphaerae]
MAAAALIFTTATATVCPACFGLVEAQPQLYVERGVSAEQRQQAASVFDQASRRVTDFYGGRHSSPRVLVCFTSRCYERIGGGGERGQAIADRAIVLSPRGVDVVIASHELAHIELHKRLLPGSDVPQWFDEGLAVLVSDDRRYLLPDTVTDRCRAEPGQTLPETLAQWRAARTGEQLYAESACRVSRWAEKHGGPAAVLELIDRLNRGESFAAIFT